MAIAPEKPAANEAGSADPTSLTSPAEPVAKALDADPWRRFMCVAYEGVILFGVVFFFAYGFSALTRFTGEGGVHRTAFQVFMFLVLGAYFVGFWSNGRRTLPMKTMGVRLVDRLGIPARTGRAIFRYLIASAGWLLPLALAMHLHGAALLLVLVPFAWTMVDPRRRALYDVLSGTRLVHER